MKTKLYNRTLLVMTGSFFMVLGSIFSFIALFNGKIISDNKEIILLVWCGITIIYYLYSYFKMNNIKNITLSIQGSTFEIRSGNIFNCSDLKVINFNEYFDTLVDNKIIAKNSLNGKFITDVLKSNTKNLDDEIEKQLSDKIIEINNKSKKIWLSKILVVVLVLAIAVLLTVMIVTSSDPKKSTDGLLTNLKAGDFEKAQEFLSGTSLINDNKFDEETEKLLFDKLEWKITKITKEDKNATIELEVTNKNFQSIISSYMQKALKAAFGGENVEQSEIENYFKDELKNEQVEKTTNNVTIKAVKEDKKWKIVADDTLVDALLPGLSDAINSIG